LLLGNWQRHKADTRIRLQQSVIAALKDPPIDLGREASDATLLVGRRVKAEGQWLSDDVVYLDNRPNQGQPGLYVLMPLRLSDDRVLIVNRGWIARDPQKRDRIGPYQTPQGRVGVVGLVIADESRFLELGAEPTRRPGTIWQNFDFAAFAKATGLVPLPIIVRADSPPGDGLAREWPDRGGVLSSQIARNEGYAFQWYAMSVGIIVLSLYYGIRNARLAFSRSDHRQDHLS
jgi:cytochrome oxidase assembly protein ShyY1